MPSAGIVTEATVPLRFTENTFAGSVMTRAVESARKRAENHWLVAPGVAEKVTVCPP